MNKDDLSPNDVELLLAELAPPEEQARHRIDRMEQSRQRACRAARSEINRVFFRRYCVRAAEYATVLCLLGGALSILWPADGDKQQAKSLAVNDIPAYHTPVTPLVPVAVVDGCVDVLETECEELAVNEPVTAAPAPAPAEVEKIVGMRPAAAPMTAPSSALMGAVPAAGPVVDAPEGSLLVDASNAYAVQESDLLRPTQNESVQGITPPQEDGDSLCLRKGDVDHELKDEEDCLALSEREASVETAPEVFSRSRAKAESRPCDLICRATGPQASAMVDEDAGGKMRSTKKSLRREKATDKSVKPAAKAAKAGSDATEKSENAPCASKQSGPDILLWQLTVTVDKMEIKGDEAVLTLTLHNAGTMDMTVGNTPQSLKKTAAIRSPKWSAISSKSETLAGTDEKKLGTIVVPARGTAQLTMTFSLIAPEGDRANREKLLKALRRAELRFTFTYFQYGKSEWFDVFHRNAAMGKK